MTLFYIYLLCLVLYRDALLIYVQYIYFTLTLLKYSLFTLLPYIEGGTKTNTKSTQNILEIHLMQLL